MKIDRMAVMINTHRVEEMKAFYREHLGLRVVFDNGDVVSMRSGMEAEVAFMRPRDGVPEVEGRGLTVCFEVADPDAEHDRIRAAGVGITMPIEDYPWGDRAFVFPDPLGVSVYVYKPIEPAEEFRRFFEE